jgi:hypothetical protein
MLRRGRNAIGRVKIKPDPADDALAMIGDRGVAMLQGMAGAAGGYWARSLEGDMIQHSFWLFDTEGNARAAEATFNQLRDMPDAPAGGNPPAGRRMTWTLRFSRRCCSQPHPLGKVKRISLNGRVVPPVPQLAALCAGSAGTSSPRNWPATRITVDAAG